MSSECEFTVFTATYNRAHLLHRVYRSLGAQTFRDFEWVVVDDGSTDRTESLIREWRVEAKFPIRYLYQRNQGKHVACNRAVRTARGRFFLTLDSDDACVPDALAKLMHYWNSIPQQQRSSFSAVTVLCKNERGAVVGDMFPNHITDSDSLDCYYRLRVRGEKWGFHRTEIMRKFPFPVPPRRLSHVPEGIVWSRISRKYKTRFVNEPLRVYYAGHDSLTSFDSVLKDSHSHLLWNQVVLNEHLDYFRYDPIEFLRHAANFCRFSFHLKEPVREQMKGLHSLAAKLLCIASLPLGAFKFLVDKRKSIVSRRRPTVCDAGSR